MGRHSADAVPSAASGGDPRDHAAVNEYETGSQARVAPRGPPASRRRLAVAVAVALLGIVLLVLGLISLLSTTDNPTGTDTQNSSSAAPTSAVSATESSTAASPTTSDPPASPAVLPVTVLNNSPLVGLAARIAAELEAAGWPIAELLDYSETEVPATTVYFTPGNAAEEEAAIALVAQFPEIVGGAEPRFQGLDGSGLTLVAVGDWDP